MKIAIFSSHEFEKDSIQRVNNDVHLLNFLPFPLSLETAILADGYDAVSIFVNDDASEKVLKKLETLGVELILLRSAGHNHVDLEYAKEVNLSVAYVPEYSPYAVAEHTLALMLALNRRLIRANRKVQEANFNLDGLTGFDFHGKTVGLLGFGKIAQKLANILLGMGCYVKAYDLHPSEEYREKGVEFVSLNELCAASDVISLHLPLNSDTRYIINSKTIALMKDGVMLINTGRGLLLDTKAVIEALKTKKIGYLGLDVYEQEGPLFFGDHSGEVLQDDKIARLMTFPNVLITSHQGFLTNEALQNIAQTTFENVDSFLGKSDNEGCFLLRRELNVNY